MSLSRSGDTYLRVLRHTAGLSPAGQAQLSLDSFFSKTCILILTTTSAVASWLLLKTFLNCESKKTINEERPGQGSSCIVMKIRMQDSADGSEIFVNVSPT